MTSFFSCPVCGYPYLREPHHYPDGAASDEICPSCGFQFGYDDDSRGFTFAAWRRNWVSAGMPWCSRGIAPPDGWDPEVQLARLLGQN